MKGQRVSGQSLVLDLLRLLVVSVLVLGFDLHLPRLDDVRVELYEYVGAAVPVVMCDLRIKPLFVVVFRVQHDIILGFSQSGLTFFFALVKPMIIWLFRSIWFLIMADNLWFVLLVLIFICICIWFLDPVELVVF